jgi:hypothetical protein
MVKKSTCLLIGLFTVTCSILVAAQILTNLSWGREIRNGKLLVVVDTQKSPSNLVFDSASFNAVFYDKGGSRLGQGNIPLPAAEIKPGQRKTWDLPHKFSQAVRVTTDTLLVTSHPDGLKADEQEIAISNEAIGPSGIVIPPPPPADRCLIYGRRAVQQAERWKALSCGASDTRWNNDATFHTNWCRDRPESEPEAETTTRDTLLRQCIRKKIVTTVPGKVP